MGNLGTTFPGKFCYLEGNSCPSNKEIHKELKGNFECVPGKFCIFSSPGIRVRIWVMIKMVWYSKRILLFF